MTELELEPPLEVRTLVGPAEFVRGLLEGGHVARVRGPLRRTKTKGRIPARIAYLKDATVKGVLRWLIRSGGWRTRAVVAGKRRREGRLWAPGIYESLKLEYSAASMDLLLRAAEWCSRPDRPFAPPDDPEVAGLAPRTTGDLLVYHLVVDALLEAPVGDAREETEAEAPRKKKKSEKADRSDKADKAEKEKADKAEREKAEKRAVLDRKAIEEGRRRLLGLSPLTALVRGDELEPNASTSETAWVATAAAAAIHLAPLFEGDRAVLLSYLDDAIARRWVDREAARRALTCDEASHRYASLGAVLEGLARAAIKAARPDALRPIARFYEEYVLRHGERESVLRDFRERSLGLVKASDRARFLAQVARLFHAARTLASEAERVLGTPFVERTEEDKVWVADYHEHAKPVLPEIEAIRRELASEVG